MSFTRTAKAGARSFKDDWEIIEAIAADALENGLALTSAAAIAEARKALSDVGKDLAVGTVRQYCLVAKFDYESSARQRTVFRRYGIRTLAICAERGVPADVAASYLSGAKKSFRDIDHEFSIHARGLGSRSASSQDPEDWNDDQWDAFDASVVAATRTVLTAFNLRQRGLYEPSVEAVAQLALLRDSDWDRGLAELVEG